MGLPRLTYAARRGLVTTYLCDVPNDWSLDEIARRAEIELLDVLVRYTTGEPRRNFSIIVLKRVEIKELIRTIKKNELWRSHVMIIS